MSSLASFCRPETFLFSSQKCSARLGGLSLHRRAIRECLRFALPHAEVQRILLVTFEQQPTTNRNRKKTRISFCIERLILRLQCQANHSSLPSGPVLRSGVLQSSFAVLTFANIRIGHLLVDRLEEITVLFVITDDGSTLRKYSLLANEQLCLLEQMELKPTTDDEDWKVNRAEFLAETVREARRKKRVVELLFSTRKNC